MKTSREEEFRRVFDRLRSILSTHAPDLVVTHDTPENYYLDTQREHNGRPLFFGAAQIKKNYVSYHLFPVYVHPELLDDISPELRKRMQGKSCFNFKREEPELFDELAELTRRGRTTMLDS